MSTASSKSNSANSGQAPAQSMAELMAKHGNDVQPLKKGEEVTGIVTALTPDIMLHVDKIDVTVMETDRKLHKQLMTMLKVGDSVKAVVLYPESDSGYPAVSLRLFMEKKTWEYLEDLQKKGEKVSVTVAEVTKGGLVVEMRSGTSGFLPNSHMNRGNSESLVGQEIQVSIAEVNREAKKVVFSQKGALTANDFANLATQYKAGTKVKGVVSGITQFGIFVTLPFTSTSGEKSTIDGLVHISEVAWEKTSDLSEIFETGQHVEAVVIGVDSRSKRIDLSIKKLSHDPFQAVLENFPAEKKITGTAKEMTQDGLIVDLGNVDGLTVEGLIKKDKIPPTTTYEIGKSVTATVVSVDARKRKVMLTPVLMEKPLMYR